MTKCKRCGREVKGTKCFNCTDNSLRNSNSSYDNSTNYIYYDSPSSSSSCDSSSSSSDCGSSDSGGSCD